MTTTKKNDQRMNKLYRTDWELLKNFIILINTSQRELWNHWFHYALQQTLIWYCVLLTFLPEQVRFLRVYGIFNLDYYIVVVILIMIIIAYFWWKSCGRIVKNSCATLLPQLRSSWSRDHKEYALLFSRFCAKPKHVFRYFQI